MNLVCTTNICTKRRVSDLLKQNLDEPHTICTEFRETNVLHFAFSNAHIQFNPAYSRPEEMFGLLDKLSQSPDSLFDRYSVIRSIQKSVYRFGGFEDKQTCDCSTGRYIRPLVFARTSQPPLEPLRVHLADHHHRIS